MSGGLVKILNMWHIVPKLNAESEKETCMDIVDTFTLCD